MRPAVTLLVVLLFFAARVASAADLNRTLKKFDFEERQSGNSEDVPMDWIKIEGPGLPHYVNGQLADDQSVSGKYSFRFDLNGGSLIYRYPAGKIRVHGGSFYRVNAMVRTGPLTNARARMTAYFADVDGHPIKNSITHSDPFVSEGDAWSPLSIQLKAPADATSIVIELGLVQASIWQASTLGRSALFEQDIRGQAWFDDVQIDEVPKLTIACDRPGNLFQRSDQVALHVNVEDRLTDDLVGRLTVTGGDGKLAFQRSGAMGLQPAGVGQVPAATILIPPLPAGWYHASLSLTSRDLAVGETSLDFVQLPDDIAQLPPDPRFGVIATDLSPAAWAQLPAILANVGAQRVKLSVWGNGGDVEAMPGGEFSKLLENLREAGIAPTACLSVPPPKVAELIGGADWAKLPAARPETWQPALSLLVARYAGYLDRWQIGSDEQAQQFVGIPAMRAAYDSVFDRFAGLVHSPDVAMPWPAWFELPAKRPATIALAVSPDVLPSQIPLYVDDLVKQKQPLSLTLWPLPKAKYGRDPARRDLVQRVAYSMAAGANRIDLPLPFSVREIDGQTVSMPDESLLTLRTILRTLGNAKSRGQVPIDPDVDAFLFDRNGEGVLLLWNKSASGPDKTIPVVLGNQPRVVDLAGNVSPILQPKDADGTTDISVGPTPMFLIGIDAKLAMLRTSFSFDNPLIESAFQAHVRRLRFTNSYAVPITGHLRLTGPAGWSVVPQMPQFSLAPGETYDAPVNIEFPYSSFAGQKNIVCSIDMQADSQVNFKVPVPLRLGLGDVGLETIARREGDDVIVQQMITNYSAKPIDYTAFVVVPGQARQERLVTALKAGATIIKKYRFAAVDFTRFEKIRSGVHETDGMRVLNDEVEVK